MVAYTLYMAGMLLSPYYFVRKVLSSHTVVGHTIGGVHSVHGRFAVDTEHSLHGRAPHFTCAHFAAGFVSFVLSLKRGLYKYQFSQFAWTHTHHISLAPTLPQALCLLC